MSPAMSDSRGHALLRRRVEMIPGALAAMLAQGLPAARERTQASQRFIVTGTGSSEAHARYLCTLLNLHTDRSAAYLPLSGFTDANPASFTGKTLIVFSQGVSPNAQLALRKRVLFDHLILFTAATPASARAAGKIDRALLLEGIVAEGGELVHFPLSEEYTTLIRFVGPMAGYLACWQFASRFPEHRLNPSQLEHLPTALNSGAPAELRDAMLAEPRLFAQGFNLVTAAPIADYAQNLACKFMEGVFWPCPSVSDFLQFAHGPFQQATAHPHPVVLLQGDSAAEAELVARSRAMLTSSGLPNFVVHVPFPPLVSIFGFEAVFNSLILELIERWDVDQVNWPGKGRDDQLYGFCGDPT